MTDKEFIFDRILKDWKFDTELDNGIGGVLLYGVENIIDGSCCGKEGFIKEVNLLYGDWYSDEFNDYFSNILGDWFEKELQKVFSDVYTSMDDVKVVLGIRNWTAIKSNGEPFFWKILMREHGEKYGKRVIKRIYDEWFQERVLSESERMMNEPWN
jgi:hypothetical protein